MEIKVELESMKYPRCEQVIVDINMKLRDIFHSGSTYYSDECKNVLVLIDQICPADTLSGSHYNFIRRICERIIDARKDYDSLKDIIFSRRETDRCPVCGHHFSDGTGRKRKCPDCKSKINKLYNDGITVLINDTEESKLGTIANRVTVDKEMAEEVITHLIKACFKHRLKRSIGQLRKTTSKKAEIVTPPLHDDERKFCPNCHNMDGKIVSIADIEKILPCKNCERPSCSVFIAPLPG